MTIDIEALRSYLLDLCGTAACTDFQAALVDVVDVECASGEELLEIALRLGVDPAGFETR